jgi:uncharacterized protein (DUF2141 family)
MMMYSFITFLWFHFGLANTPTSQCYVTANFEGKVSGTLYVAVIDNEKTWPNAEKAAKKLEFDVLNQTSASFDLGKLPVGKYGITCFLDENKNARLDQNWMGVPIEAYGFSRKARPKYRGANWQEVAFSLDAKGHTEHIEVLKWKL